MRFLYFFFAVVVLLFQICPGYTQFPPADDTVQCRAKGFCKLGECPPETVEIGTCHGGRMSCCAK
ncbi:gallinacin-10-like [Elgaria multicarinata webbii]|uniref:gallinacin-10-like n=1 Tax=Elgaria multicarinata webbii TaxID=159646 RepID=UPI002FCD66EA